MLKKRLIFTLLASSGRFMLSRNFSLQAAGDLEWIRDFYDFSSIATSIDELVVLNVDRQAQTLEGFVPLLRQLGRHCFMPIAAGGGVRSVDDASSLLRAGADKIVVSSPLFDQPDLVRQLVRRFGSQCVVASIDYRRDGASSQVFHRCGSQAVGIDVPTAVEVAQELGAGELYLTSIARDGTGQGLDEDFVADIAGRSTLPVIASGGAGNFAHLASALSREHIAAVSTANLFNFMGDGLTQARQHIMDSGVALAQWPPMETLDAD